MFNLARYFSTLSFLLIGLVVGSLTYYFHSITLEQLGHHEQARAETFARAFEHSLRSQFRPLADSHPIDTLGGLRESASQPGLREALGRLMHGTDVIKVKVFSPTGLTIFSTDDRDVGGSLLGRDVIATSVPIYSNRDGLSQIDGVIEIYLDTTASVDAVDRKFSSVALAVLGVLGLLYLAQYLVERHVHGIFRMQAQVLTNSNQALDRRVNERTSALQDEIIERRQIERRLEHLAHHDALTELPNRLRIRTHLTQSLVRMEQANTQLAVFFIGMDNFKEINETLGHAVGDELLVAVSRRLQAHLRPGDKLARLGSDEFFCVLEDIQALSTVSDEADKLLAQFQQPFAVGSNQIYLSTSIGISLAPQDAQETVALVRNANAALYKAKSLGRNRSHFYTPEMTAAAQERLHLAGLLRQAIVGDELRIHYQPKVNPLNGQLCGAEALLRWTSAERGAISPARFIPLAEDIGFIVDLGTWVLRETCRQMVTWDEAGFQVPRISVNLSVKQLARKNFSQLLRDILQDSGLAPDRLELEITESVIMEVDNAYAILAELRELGVHFSIDDFGTGYSSLAYLKKLPVQTLKIDRAFVTGIGQNPSDEAIIEAILKIASSLGLHTVAEGVETEAQLAYLRNMGCDQIQGYFYSKPVPSSDLFDNWFYRQPQMAGSSVRQFPTQRSARS